jgi:hypothetical protein
MSIRIYNPKNMNLSSFPSPSNKKISKKSPKNLFNPKKHHTFATAFAKMAP